MALKRAGAPAPTATSDGTAPEIPDEIPRHGGNGRPWIRRHGLTYAPGDEATDTRRGRGEFYTRASSFGKPIEDTYKIGRARERRIVFGLSRHRELVTSAQAVAGQDERADRDELERLADKAVEYARGDVASTMGTAFHKLRERADAGEDLSYLPADLRAGLAAWDRLTARFRMVASETFVVNDNVKAAGTFDALFEVVEPVTIHRGGELLGALDVGDRIIGDLKSGRWGPKWFGPVYGCQGWIYATGEPYTHRRGRYGWPDGRAPRTDWAVIPYVPVDSPQDASLHWINLDAARLRIELVQSIHYGRRCEDLFVEHVEQLPAQVSVLGVVALLRAAGSEAELERIWRAHQSVWTEDCSRMARARLRELTADVPA